MFVVCLLPPAYVVRGKVLFSRVSVCSHLREEEGVPPSQVQVGVPPIRDWMRYPPTIRRKSHIANTCYSAGGMPLAFTQHGFLVCVYFTPGFVPDIHTCICICVSRFKWYYVSTWVATKINIDSNCSKWYFISQRHVLVGFRLEKKRHHILLSGIFYSLNVQAKRLV